MLVWLRTRDPVALAVVVLFLGVFVAGLASHSLAGGLLGKTARLWFITLASGAIALGTLLAVWRFNNAARLIKRALLLGVVSLVLFEAVGWLFPKLWPVPVLRRTPEWVQDVVGERAFKRGDYRPLGPGDAQDDAELGYRSLPNLDLQVIQGEINFRQITDSQGFANVDATLYGHADVVVAGDSYTRGYGVELEQSWPQLLAQRTGLRVLNLGSDGWHMYQYPRVLERFAADLSPKAVVVTLRSFEDLSPSFYYYADYMLEHPEIKNWHEFPGRQPEGAWARFGNEAKQNIRNRNFVRLLYRLAENAAPFATNTAAYLMDPLGPEALCGFSLSGTRTELQFKDLGQYVGSGIEPNLGPINLDRVAEDLARVRKFAAEKGARLYFVYLPYPEEIYIPLLSSAAELNECASSVLASYQSGEIDLRRFYSQWEDALGPDSALLRDATPHLQSLAARGQQLSWRFDDHPAPAGHQGIAEFVAGIIQN